MTFTRVLIPAALSACLLLAVPALASDHGGAPADPLAQDASGGGILAPSSAEDEAVAEAAAAETPRAAQETPTTPGGEEQPPAQEPNGEQPPSEVPGEETPENGGTGGEETAGETGGGGLPRTGFELAALTAIGLGLLLAGGALWPTSSWPPPRDRLSRSTPRR
jgi:hypothetical protein